MPHSEWYTASVERIEEIEDRVEELAYQHQTASDRFIEAIQHDRARLGACEKNYNDQFEKHTALQRHVDKVVDNHNGLDQKHRTLHEETFEMHSKFRENHGDVQTLKLAVGEMIRRRPVSAVGGASEVQQAPMSFNRLSLIHISEPTRR